MFLCRIGMLLTVLPAVAADVFSGTWILQADKREGASAWAQYDKEGDMLVWSNPTGLVAKFRIDGKEYPTATTGRTVSFTKIDDTTLEGTQRLNGQVWQVERMTFSADGQTRSIVRRAANGNGMSELTRTSKRAGGSVDRTLPLVGRWESDWSTATGTPPVLTIQVDANGMQISGLHTFDAAFDGKEHTLKRSPTADTVTLRRVDERTIEQTLKSKGNIVGITTFTVSPDGNTLTASRQRRDGNTVRDVFTRQSK